jgi:hypothetical protein
MNQDFITQQTLEDRGFDLTGEDVDALLDDLNETLEERVSAQITESLNEAQVEDLVAMQDSASEKELGAWLEEHVTGLQAIIQDQIEILLTEIAEEEDEEE